jgi:HD-GYP domain-containing protein (c-di-GMP phosphodiesterase class II)
MLNDGQRSPEAKGAMLGDFLLAWTRQFYAEPACRSATMVTLARELITWLYRLLQSVPQVSRFAWRLRQPEAGLAAHCFNVALLGLAYACQYRWPESAARTWGLGALVHDLGMTMLGESWGAGGPLSSEELEALHAHPRRGVGLLTHLAGLSGKIFAMVAQHHENADGSGYPLGLPGCAIHPLARLLRVVDSFESLTAVRPWRGPLSPAKALACMRYTAARRADFDARVLADFQRLWSSWDQQPVD